MKRNIFIALAAMMVFGLAVAVYALNTNTSVETSATVSCCCCSGDSCPMKGKNAAATTTTAADKHEGCCCKGDGASCPMMKDGKMAADGDHSCPMMKAGAEHKMDGKMEGKMEGMDHSKMAADGDHSCPMMKDGKAHDMKDMKSMDPKTHDMHKNMAATADGKSGCTCACCAHGKEKKDAPAI